MQSFDCEPKVVKKEGKYHVSCCYWSDFKGLVQAPWTATSVGSGCYWSDFKGLVQEAVDIMICESKATFKDIDESILVEYKSYICF